MQNDWVILAFKNIFRNKRRSILSALAILVVAAAMTILASFIAGMNNQLLTNLRALDTGDVTVQHSDFTKYKIFNPLGYLVDLEDLKSKLADQKDIKIYGRVNFFANYYNNEDSYGVQIFAFNDDDELAKSVIKLDAGRFASDRKEAVVSRGLASEKNIKIGDSVMLMTTTADRGSNAVSYKVVGIANMQTGGYNTNTVIPNLEGADWLIRTPLVTTALITTKKSNIDNLTSYINKNFVEDSVKAYTIWDSRLGLMVRMQRKFFNFISMVFFILGSTVVINTSIMAIMERVKEIGVMRALGANVKEIQFLFFLETIFLSFCGTVVGLITGAILTIPLEGMGRIFDDPKFKSISDGFYLSEAIPFDITPMNLLAIFGLSMFISFLVATIPTRRIAKINVCDSLRVEN